MATVDAHSSQIPERMNAQQKTIVDMPARLLPLLLCLSAAADDTAPCDRQCRVSANVHTCGRLNVSFTCKELQDALKCDCSGCCLSPKPTLAVTRSAFIRGVNLGSYLVPERWMVPSFYEGTDATSLCGFAAQNRSTAAARMRRHLAEYIGEDDFAWLAAHGFNAVRVPLGYWNVIPAGPAGVAYPAGPDESLAALDRLFAWGRAHGVALLLDLHGAPGSQNGADHSGCDAQGIGWGSGDTIEVRARGPLLATAPTSGARPAALGAPLHPPLRRG